MCSEDRIDSHHVTKRKVLLANFFSLSGLQVANNVLPLITLPYIVRVIGVEYFGLVSFAQAFVIFFNIFVKYGFDYSATREISVKRDRPGELSRIVSMVLGAKLILLLVSTVIFLAIILFIPRFREDFLLYVFTYLLVIGVAMFPTWLFQGMEKLTSSAIFNFIIKLGFTISIFVFIRQEEDYIYIPLINGIGNVTVGTVALIYAYKVFNIRTVFPALGELIDTIKKGWTIFASMLVINLYTTSNAFLLGLLAGNIYVGYFSAAEKVVKALQSLLLLPLSQTLYPHIGNALHRSYENGILMLKRLTFLIGGVTFLASAVLLIFAKPAILIIFGSDFDHAVTALRVIVFLPFIIGIGNVFAVQGLLNLKLDRQFFTITGIGAVISISLNFLLVPFLYEVGTSIAWLAAESFITAASFVVLFKKGINLLDFSVLKKYVPGTLGK